MNSIRVMDELWKSAEALGRNGFLRAEDFEVVEEAYKQNIKKMDATARELGFINAQDFSLEVLHGQVGSQVPVHFKLASLLTWRQVVFRSLLGGRCAL